MDGTLEVQWNGRYNVEVRVFGVWQGMVEGLCGNFNNILSDEYTGPNNVQVSVSKLCLWRAQSRSNYISDRYIDSKDCIIETWLNKCKGRD